MLEVGVIELAETKLAAPIVFASMKDGFLRFYVDYRKLNSVTVRHIYCIPGMDECMDSLGDPQIFFPLYRSRR